jgi:hypothetical protein
MNVLSRAMRVGIVVAGCVFVSGCKGQLIKDTAATYVDSGTKLVSATKDLNDADQASNYEAIWLKVEYTTDKECKLYRGNPMNPLSTYVRSGEKDSTLEDLAKNFDDTSPSSATQFAGCRQLLRCESNPFENECMSTCYSEAESECIDKISQHVQAVVAADTPKGEIWPKTPKIQDMDAELLSKLSVIELAKHSTPESINLALSLNAFSAYLATLSSLANEKPKDVTPIASHFSNWEGKIFSAYSSASPVKPSSADQSDQKELAGAGGAADKLIGDIKTIAEDERSGRQIAGDFNATETDYQNLLSQLDSQFSSAVSRIKGVENVQFYEDALEPTIRKFASAKTAEQRATERSAYLAAVESHKQRLASADALNSNYTKLRKNLTDAHDKLKALIDDPRNTDKRQIVEATVMNFVTIVSDIVALYSKIS